MHIYGIQLFKCTHLHLCKHTHTHIYIYTYIIHIYIQYYIHNIILYTHIYTSRYYIIYIYVIIYMHPHKYIYIHNIILYTHVHTSYILDLNFADLQSPIWTSRRRPWSRVWHCQLRCTRLLAWEGTPLYSTRRMPETHVDKCQKSAALVNGNSRILKWRYVSTILLAIFCSDIPLHRPYIGLIYARYLQFRILKWPLNWCGGMQVMWSGKQTW